MSALCPQTAEPGDSSTRFPTTSEAGGPLNSATGRTSQPRMRGLGRCQGTAEPRRDLGPCTLPAGPWVWGGVCLKGTHAATPRAPPSGLGAAHPWLCPESPLLLPSRAGMPETRPSNASATAFERPPVAGTSDFREFVLEMQKTIRDLRKQVGRPHPHLPGLPGPSPPLGPVCVSPVTVKGRCCPHTPGPRPGSLQGGHFCLCPSFWLGSSWAALSCPWTSWDRGPSAVGCPLARWVRGAGSPRTLAVRGSGSGPCRIQTSSPAQSLLFRDDC